MRKNPNVQQAQLNHVLNKFALELQQWQFKPHYLLQLTKTTSQDYSVTRNGMVTTNMTGVDAGVSVLSPIGTNVKLTSTNNEGNHYNPGLSLQIMQPLMRGFGRSIVEMELYNAMDSEKIGRLNVEGALQTTITAVINAYLDVVSMQNRLKIDEQALAKAENSVMQTRLFIKAGRKAGVELVTVEASAASARSQIETDRNNLTQAKYALLGAIGLDPNTVVEFEDVEVPALIKNTTCLR